MFYFLILALLIIGGVLMTIHYGNKKIGKIYVGNTSIGKVYKGETLLYESNPFSSINTYTINTKDSYWGIVGINLSETIPANKKFKVLLISQSHTKYGLTLDYLVDNTIPNSIGIYSSQTGINNYNKDLTSSSLLNSCTLTNFDSTDAVVTIQVYIYK